eukprot:Tamp_27224.p1 GENE.Tamp_27224~~Tamp_27224.p1  ORF type:complete len:198 (-),score=30.53 Tamp_27224:46-639(-)
MGTDFWECVLERDVEGAANWATWVKRDATGDARILRTEFPAFLEFVRTHYLSQDEAAACIFVPDIQKSKEEWFDYFDTAGALKQGEIERALIKTLRVDDKSREQVVSALAAVWSIFDHTGSGRVSREDFLAPDGLGDCISALVATHEPEPVRNAAISGDGAEGMFFDSSTCPYCGQRRSDEEALAMHLSLCSARRPL